MVIRLIHLVIRLIHLVIRLIHFILQFFITQIPNDSLLLLQGLLLEKKTSSSCFKKKREKTCGHMIYLYVLHLPRIQIRFLSYLTFTIFSAFSCTSWHENTRNAQIQILPFNVTAGENLAPSDLKNDFLTFLLLDETVKVFTVGNSLTNTATQKTLQHPNIWKPPSKNRS